jgi:hypothetical protein
MTTVEELTRAIETGAAELRAAIAGAEGYWDSAVLPPEADEVNPRASGDAWTPQGAADHAIGSMAFFAAMAAAGFDADLEAPGSPDVSSPATALASLDHSIATCRAALEAASDSVLGRPTGLGDRQVNYAATRGQAIQKDVAGAFWMAALHSADHAQQIASGADRT